ncbi:hypothetical protein [Raoultella ornithinolytica]|uniref:hypothetical protein n=1 Tax=Raoultella ornithinolytica TaxID=54291 RepID=UPI001F250299|nr:hypothetical protein [Raoultella ornithinolytica]MCF1305779.1 hypothetical protein [Raoultella ornithinolytica]
MENKINNPDENSAINPPSLDFSCIDREIKISRSDFLRMVEPGIGGTIDFDHFGEWVKIASDGLYVNTDHEGIVDLTPEEAAVLSLHPTGNIKEPVLKFPFTISELVELLKFTNEEGIDFPISHDVFCEIIADKQKNNIFSGKSEVKEVCSSSLAPSPEAQKKERGVDKINRVRKEYHEYIRNMAKEIWFKEGDDSEYKMTEMAVIIHNELVSKGSMKVLGLASIKKILSPIAPDYAKKPGRPKKHN